MDYENVYYVTDSRNATPVRDHRVVTTTVPARAVVAQPAATAMPATLGWTSSPSAGPYQYPQPSYFGPQAMSNSWGYPLQPPYIMPPVAPSSNLASILGGFGDIGSLANIIAQVFAALLPLPASPTPQDNNDSDSATNAAVNSSNMIRYQSALALFARRDQQILTLGSVLKELFKRPGLVG